MKEVDYKDFLLVFEKSETMPKDKNALMVQLFTFYNAGRKNENERIKNRNIENIG
jgi:hypothetical protein